MRNRNHNGYNGSRNQNPNRRYREEHEYRNGRNGRQEFNRYDNTRQDGGWPEDRGYSEYTMDERHMNGYDRGRNTGSVMKYGYGGHGSEDRYGQPQGYNRNDNRYDERGYDRRGMAADRWYDSNDYYYDDDYNSYAASQNDNYYNRGRERDEEYFGNRSYRNNYENRGRGGNYRGEQYSNEYYSQGNDDRPEYYWD
jgi:hypothetical protein